MLYSKTEEFAQMKSEFHASLPAIMAGNDPYCPPFSSDDPVTGDLSLSRILRAVCAVTRFRQEAIRSERRFPNLARARRLYFLVADEFSGYSKTEIGRYVNKEPASVGQSLNKARELIRKDEKFAELYTSIRQKLGA